MAVGLEIGVHYDKRKHMTVFTIYRDGKCIDKHNRHGDASEHERRVVIGNIKAKFGEE